MSPFRRSIRLVAAAALVCGLVGTGCNSTSPVSAASDTIKDHSERKAAPDFALKDADGKAVRLSDYKGKVVLLNFWATWCGPCKLEMPWFVEFERKYRNQGFAVIGVSMDEEGWAVIKPFISDMAVNYRIVQGDDTTASLYGGVESLPTTFIIDRNGRVAATHIGLRSKSVFEDDIKQLLGSKAAAVRNAVQSALSVDSE